MFILIPYFSPSLLTVSSMSWRPSFDVARSAVSSAYMRLLMTCPPMFIPGFSLSFLNILSVYQLNNSGVRGRVAYTVFIR